MDWELGIRKVHNGYVLTGKHDETNEPYEEVIESDNHIEYPDNKCELKEYRELGLRVLEYFGLQNSKHNKYRLEIKIINQQEQKEQQEQQEQQEPQGDKQ